MTDTIAIDANKYKGQHTMTFTNLDGDVGKISWDGGVFEFTGKADESAKVFFDFLKQYVDAYLHNNT